MKHLYLLIPILCLILHLKTPAQSNFQKGYVFVSETDILYGEIDNKSYYENSQFCDFRTGPDDSVRRYHPEDLFAYHFTDGKYYISKKVLGMEKDPTIFLEYLVDGKMDVFFYQDEIARNHYFVSKDSSQLRELVYAKKEEVIDGKRMTYETKPFTGLLGYYTSDCPQIKSNIINMGEPNHKNLVRLASRYHDLTCKGERCIIYEKSLKHKFSLYLNGGLQYHIIPGYFLSDDTAMYNPSGVYPVYSVGVLFQQFQRRESFYLGIGVVAMHDDYGSRPYIGIPFSVNYLNPRPGLSPAFSYSFDVMQFGMIQSLSGGIKYQMKKSAILLTADLKTFSFIVPYATSLNIGYMHDLN
jgi:hypothetical protein